MILIGWYHRVCTTTWWHRGIKDFLLQQMLIIMELAYSLFIAPIKQGILVPIMSSKHYGKY